MYKPQFDKFASRPGSILRPITVKKKLGKALEIVRRTGSSTISGIDSLLSVSLSARSRTSHPNVFHMAGPPQKLSKGSRRKDSDELRRPRPKSRIPQVPMCLAERPGIDVEDGDASEMANDEDDQDDEFHE